MKNINICEQGREIDSPQKMGYTKLCTLIAPQDTFYKAFMKNRKCLFLFPLFFTNLSGEKHA